MNLKSINKIKILVVTAHGKQELLYSSQDSILDCLQKNNIPWSAVSIYKLVDNNQLHLYSHLDAKIETLNDVNELHVYFNRNINPFIYNLNHLNIVEAKNESMASVPEPTSEYIYQDINSETGVVNNYLKKLTQSECQQVVAERIHTFIDHYLKADDSIVVGISGGGDSNALLHGLTTFDKFKLNIKPVILKGIYDWDKGVPRAQELCDKYGLSLNIIEASEVKSILNIKSEKDMVSQFEKIFPGDDFEFLGTLLIRLVLSQKGKDWNIKYICTGLNLEDVLCECLYRISNKLLPLPFPIRELNEVTLLYPLWECPKRIIDGCFPKFSLENYEARYPCFSLGRNLYYHMAYTLQSQFPGVVEKFLYGLQGISNLNEPVYKLDEQLNIFTERKIPLNIKDKFLKLLEID